MREELKKLMREYKDYCDEQTDKIAEDPDDPRMGMSFTFDGFYAWLNNDLYGAGELPKPAKTKKEEK